MGIEKKGLTMVGKYIQGPDTIHSLAEYVQDFGKSALLIIDTFFYKKLKNDLEEKFREKNIDVKFLEFSEEITIEKITAYTQEAKMGFDMVVGIGGGKTMDSAKAVAEYAKIFCVIVPTTAASDAPCSSLSIIYQPEKKTRTILKCKRNPDMVLVDSRIIAQAPTRFIVAGIGDAMSTYYEMRANQDTNSENFMPGGFYRTNLSVTIAELCKNILLRDGKKAVLAAKEHICTIALENVIEANILLSGAGFENTGCAGAHSISAGLSAIPHSQAFLHGEKVAFGVLCQLVMENRDMKEVEAVFDLFYCIGLPTTLADFQIGEGEENDMAKAIARKSLEGTFWKNEPFRVDEERIYSAIIETDRINTVLKQNR